MEIISTRAIVLQRKTRRPVQFEISEQTRAALLSLIHSTRLGLAERMATLIAVTAINTMAFKPRSSWRTLQPTADDALPDELTLG